MNVCHSSRDVWKHQKLVEITTRSLDCRVYVTMLRAAYSGKVHAITCPKNNFLNQVLNSVGSRGKEETAACKLKKNQKLKTSMLYIVRIQPSACEACDGWKSAAMTW